MKLLSLSSLVAMAAVAALCIQGITADPRVSKAEEEKIKQAIKANNDIRDGKQAPGK